MVALVGTVKVIASGYSASHTFTLDAAVASGNALILAFQSPGTPTSVLDSTSTPLVASATPQLTNEGNYQYFYHLTAITDGPTTVTVAFAGGTGLSGHCMEVSGLAASPVDNFDYELSGNVSSFVANYTTAAANALVVGVVDISSGLGMNVPTSGFVEAVIESWSSTFYNLDAGAAGAKTVTVNTDTANARMSAGLLIYAAASGGGTSLVVQDMAHAVGIDNVVLTSNTTLTVADSTHALAIDNIALTTQTTLAIAEMLHGMVMDSITLTSSTALTIAEMNHGVAIDNVTLSTLTGTSLVVDDLLHALSIDNMALTTQTALVIADLLHGLAIDGVTLTTTSVLAVADMLHTVAMDNLTLVAFNGTTLAIADALHAVAIDNTTLGIDNIALVIADVLHGVAIDNMALTSATALVIADLLHNHTIDNVVLFIPGGGYSTLDLIFKILTNRQELNPANGTFTLYDDDSTTVLYTAAAWADTAGTVPYSGGKLQRIDALQ